MYYKARWYDPLLGRFNQADSIVPASTQGIQAWDRYAYVSNNPILHNDPTGHDVGCAGLDASSCQSNGILKPSIIEGRKNRDKSRPYSGPVLPTQETMGYSLEEFGGLYGLGWTNFFTAFSISTNLDASPQDRALALLYIQGWAGGHYLGAVGVGLAIYGAITGVVGGGAACAVNPQCGQRVVNGVQTEISRIQQLANNVSNWLGDDLVAFRNKAGDFIIRNAENTRRFRFDYNDVSPHQSPHMHLEWLENSVWTKIRIFPLDVYPKR
jgi:hypothetical protein